MEGKKVVRCPLFIISRLHSIAPTDKSFHVAERVRSSGMGEKWFTTEKIFSFRNVININNFCRQLYIYIAHVRFVHSVLYVTDGRKEPTMTLHYTFCHLVATVCSFYTVYNTYGRKTLMYCDCLEQSVNGKCVFCFCNKFP